MRIDAHKFTRWEEGIDQERREEPAWWGMKAEAPPLTKKGVDRKRKRKQVITKEGVS